MNTRRISDLMGMRARGIKLDLSSNKISEKTYFDPSDATCSFNDRVFFLSQKMPILEYSLNSQMLVDSINFHTCCQSIENCLSIKCDSPVKDSICQIFDKSYKAYTLGLRFNGTRQIIAESIYYYPTVWKGNRFGISGLTDHDEIMKQSTRFANILILGQQTRQFLFSLSEAAYKFKGVCITTSQSGAISYKLYFRIDAIRLKEFFSRLYDFDKYNCLYGDVVLIALRLSSGVVSGLNFYYSR